MNCFKNGKLTNDSCFGCEIKSSECELFELVKAKQDKRCVVLPCKVGDTVYTTIYDVVEETKVRTFFVGHPSYNAGEPDPRYEMMRVTNYDIPLRNFGKTVFLTHEEAEAALAKEDNDERD